MPNNLIDSLPSFDEVYATIQVGKKSLLLGNGFSMAYDAERFSFTNLLQAAIKEGIITHGSNIHQVFQRLKTADFEKVLRHLDQMYEIVDVYCPDVDKSQIERDTKALKKHLVNTVTNNHPDKSTDIDEARSRQCAGFLSKFDRIYSLNYDLLAYWVIMQNRLFTTFTDGFGDPETEYGEPISNDYVVYKDNQHEFLFLHGGLHLFDNRTETIKLTFCRTNETLKKQIYEKLISGKYPVFVSEGSSDDKLEKIKHNYYLNHCYKALKKQSGSLMIYGTSLKSNDDHIKQAIIESQFKNIYIGVYAESEFQHIQLLKDTIESRNNGRKSQKTVHLFDARTVTPWAVPQQEVSHAA